MSARHLYVHLPFCSHRCGYCDFVTVTGHDGEHGGYVDALLAELELERGHLAGEVDTVFLGGGTPTFTEPAALARLLVRPAGGGGDDGRGEPGDRDARPRRAAARARRRPRLARRAELPAAPAGDARAARPPGGRPRRGAHAPGRGLRQRLARPDLRDPGPERRRSRARPRRGARARAGAPVLLRARGEARNALHARARRGARASGRRDGGLLRAGRRDADRGRLPLVRDGQLLPRSTAIATSARATTSATGSGATISGSASARSRRSAGCGGGTRRASRATWPRWAGASARSESSSRSTPDVQARERVLLGLRLDEPLRTAGLDAAIDHDALHGSSGSGSRRCARTRDAARRDPARPLPRRRRHGRVARLTNARITCK